MLKSAGGRFALCAAIACLLNPSSRQFALASGSCSSSAADINEAFRLIQGANMPPVSSQHAVLFAPSAPLATNADMGGSVTGRAYKLLPTGLGANHMETAFTKVVLVGHSESANGGSGLIAGIDVCGDEGTQGMEELVQNWRAKVSAQLNSVAPDVFQCSHDQSLCPAAAEANPSFASQLPFLHAIFEGSQDSPLSGSLNGKILPVLMQNQNVELGVKTGDALHLLVASGGPWQAEKVLFVFGGDLSHGLDAGTATQVDQNSTVIATESSAASAAIWFSEERNGAGYGSKAVPHGYGPLLAAARLADLMGLEGTTTHVENSGRYCTAACSVEEVTYVKGYGSILYWKDERPLNERIGSSSLLASKKGFAFRGAAEKEVQPHSQPAV